jgi:hypothetical protein
MKVPQRGRGVSAPSFDQPCHLASCSWHGKCEEIACLLDAYAAETAARYKFASRT